MYAKIDIKTPAGRSLEGFPREISTGQIQMIALVGSQFALGSCEQDNVRLELHKGDIITIEVL